jgi:NAD(P)H-hydrate epimerase
MQPLPQFVYATSDVRAADAHAIRDLGVPGYTLMARAGESALTAIRAQWPMHRRLVIVCGRGNNGGDGYVVARYARAAGLEVCVTAPLGTPSRSADAERAAADWTAAGGAVEPWSPGVLARGELIVDALFGTGLQRDLTGDAAAVVAAMNGAGRPIVALDVPSGLDSDTGQPRGAAVRAQLTVTFVGLKAGLFVGFGPEFAGRIVCDDLDVPAEAFASRKPALRRITEAELRAALPRRTRTSHKGTHGRVLLVGGGEGMPGAIRLAGEAALRSGAGLVTVATWPAHAAVIAMARPELICVGCPDAATLAPLIDAAEVVAIGPGLGRTPWAEALVEAVYSAARPVVADADALNLLAARPRRRQAWCLTPHPGEAARLLGCTNADVQADRLAAVHALTGRYGAVSVLKGAGTLVAAPDSTPWLCDRGNPGMAAAGMGDVLTGIVASLAAQQLGAGAASPDAVLELAAAVGVLVHATAGDLAARGGERGIVASDLTGLLPQCVNPST